MTLDIGQVFSLLSDDDRRRLLLALADAPESASIEVPNDGYDGAQMNHVHLPKLTDAGLVQWDRDADLVCRGPNWEAAVDALEVAADHHGAAVAA